MRKWEGRERARGRDCEKVSFSCNLKVLLPLLVVVARERDGKREREQHRNVTS